MLTREVTELYSNYSTTMQSDVKAKGIRKQKRPCQLYDVMVDNTVAEIVLLRIYESR